MEVEVCASGGGCMAAPSSTPVDLTALPQGAGTIAVQPGETWYFQRWHRDVIGGTATSNFTTSLAVTFR